MALPKLSLVIIGYNMARELPRTIRSFSPSMQRGIGPDEYELILVDNGSTAPFDAAALKRSAANLTILSAPAPTPSPVGAINFGLEAALWSGSASTARAWPRLDCWRWRWRRRECTNGP